MYTEPKPFSIPMWWFNGKKSYRRDLLPASHPENLYNYVQRLYGIPPEFIGIDKPVKVKEEDSND